MAMKKRQFSLLPILLIISPLIFLVSCGSVNTPLRVTEVKSIPENFVPLMEIKKECKDILECATFENAVIYFANLDGFTIEQRLLNDDTFLLSFQDEWYIEASSAAEIISKAKTAYELQNKDFEIGEPIALYDATNDSFSFTLESIRYEDAASGERQLCLLDFTVSGNDANVKSASSYYSKAITSSGQTIEDFIVISEHSVGVLLSLDDTLETVYIKSPFYSENIRRIKVN